MEYKPQLRSSDLSLTKRILNTPSLTSLGLAFQDGVLYEGTGLNGKSSLRKVDLETGL